jgi:apolipoprotein D and lipocalin family protein
VGTWYEIATIPQRFQKDSVAVTATYTLREDGKITVVNKCRKKALDGELKVQFFWPFFQAFFLFSFSFFYLIKRGV